MCIFDITSALFFRIHIRSSSSSGNDNELWLIFSAFSIHPPIHPPLPLEIKSAHARRGGKDREKTDASVLRSPWRHLHGKSECGVSLTHSLIHSYIYIHTRMYIRHILGCAPLSKAGINGWVDRQIDRFIAAGYQLMRRLSSKVLLLFFFFLVAENRQCAAAWTATLDQKSTEDDCWGDDTSKLAAASWGENAPKLEDGPSADAYGFDPCGLHDERASNIRHDGQGDRLQHPGTQSIDGGVDRWVREEKEQKQKKKKKKINKAFFKKI